MARGRARQRALDRLDALYRSGEYEEAEAGARDLAGTPSRPWGKPGPQFQARALAAKVAVAHGRGAEVLADLEALAAQIPPINDVAHLLLLSVRHDRAVVLDGQGRYTEAEAEALSILHALSRLAHVFPVWRPELQVLATLAHVLCGQGRHEEAEAIARGNLPRADSDSVAALHAALVRSLNGQSRYEEALDLARSFTPEPDRAACGRLGLVTAEALYGMERRDEAEAAVREVLTDGERCLHPAHPRIREARALLARITGEGPGRKPGE